MTRTDDVRAPDVPHRPPEPTGDHGIALIGSGPVTHDHLEGYRQAGFDVVAFCDLDRDRAVEMRDTYYPDATVYTDHQVAIADEAVDVVDAATHPDPRVEIIEDAIRAGRHVISQKPFVLDLDTGQRLVDLAEDHGVRLAVNQNGRWAPHWSYLRHVVRRGVIGDIHHATFERQWDKDFRRDESPDRVRNTLLFDYAIHWFDILTCLFDEPATAVTATRARTASQSGNAPMIAHSSLEYPSGAATITFHGHADTAPVHRTRIDGPHGAIVSHGPGLREQTVELHRNGEMIEPGLDGSWYPTGFRGTMAELLAAVEAGREPGHSARHNLQALECCFAAAASADRGTSVTPGEIRSLPDSDD